MQRENYNTDRIDVSDAVLERHRRIADDVVSEESYGLLIGGEWIDSDGGTVAEAIDATTGERLAEFQNGTADDVDRAVAAARESFDGSWGNKSPQQRSELLFEVADELETRKTEIARLDSLEVGKPNKHSLFVDMTIMVEQFRYFASLVRATAEGRRPPADDSKHIYTRREPYGVVGCISAWTSARLVLTRLSHTTSVGTPSLFTET